MRSRCLAFVALLACTAGAPAAAQEAAPRLPLVALDLHGTFLHFPGDAQLAASRGLASPAELPGLGLGVQVGAQLYPLRWRAITFGVGGELTTARARSAPPAGAGQPLMPVTERFTYLAPQVSLNFGTGRGWSYLSAGLGRTTWAIVPEGGAPLPVDRERLKTIDYGGGARWFARPHLAFSFDVRFHAINPGTPAAGLPPSPRTTLLVIGAGISVK